MRDELKPPPLLQRMLTRFLVRRKIKESAKLAVVNRLQQYFSAPLTSLHIVTDQFELCDHANLQLALDAYCQAHGESAELLGVAAKFSHGWPSLSRLGTGIEIDSPVAAPVRYTSVTLADGKQLPCAESGIYLMPTQRLAVLVCRSEMGLQQKLMLEVMSPARDLADSFVTELRDLMRAHNMFRGRVISLAADALGNNVKVQFHALPGITRDAIVLPRGLLERVERQSLGVAKHRDALAAAGRHLKRGILLHGPPGTGKTLTAMYLAKRMPDRSTILVTAQGTKLLGRCCTLARVLQPSMVVIEDVDLIAGERNRQATPLLFELLNEMDGLAEDADILFLLTTNRPKVLERALSARPGRVDQAIEIPLPDADCRARLFELYGRGLRLRLREPERFVERTAGASGAFIRELFRRAALFSAEDGQQPMTVEDRHLDQALCELVVDGGELTQSFLGFQAQRNA